MSSNLRRRESAWRIRPFLDFISRMLEAELVSALERNSKSLMIVLHGLGDSMEGYRWLPQALRLPWMNYLLVNAPDSYYGGYSWYDFAGDPGPGIKRSRDLLFELVNKQRADGFPVERMFLFGFSQGCLMTIDVGVRYPHRFAGLIGISGYAFEPLRLVKELSPAALEQSFLLTHGTADSLIPIALVRSHLTVLKSAGVRIEWNEFEKDHTIAGEDELGVIRDFVCRNATAEGR